MTPRPHSLRIWRRASGYSTLDSSRAVCSLCRNMDPINLGGGGGKKGKPQRKHNMKKMCESVMLDCTHK